MDKQDKETVATSGSEMTRLPDVVLARAFARLDSLAFGIAVGSIAGTGVLLATVILVLRGGETVGPHLSLLAQYIPGYSVTWTGSLIGGVGGFAGGFVSGMALAVLRNAVITLYVRLTAFWGRLDRFLDDM